MSEFAKILAEVQAMHDKKQKDYGKQGDPFSNVRASEDFGIPGWVGCLVRANDKMRRLQKFAQGGILVNESVEDSFLDLITYVAIGLAIFREQQTLSAEPVLEYLVGADELHNRPTRYGE